MGRTTTSQGPEKPKIFKKLKPEIYSLISFCSHVHFCPYAGVTWDATLTCKILASHYEMWQVIKKFNAESSGWCFIIIYSIFGCSVYKPRKAEPENNKCSDKNVFLWNF